jgi:pimeloyl-ACP methyl ester carboxylesterase
MLNKQILIPDLPEHTPPAVSSDAVNGDSLTDVIQSRLPRETLDIIGYSLGAKIALQLASARPQQFRRIVTIGIGDKAFAQEIFCGNPGTTGSSRVSSPMAVPGGNCGNREREIAILRAAALCIGPKTLLINGDADEIAQPDAELRAALPGLTYILLTGVAHSQLISDLPVRRTATRFLDMIDERDRHANHAWDRPQ